MTIIYHILIHRKRQQSHIPGTLDSPGQHPLVVGTIPGDPARQDLSPLAHIFTELVNIFIINVLSMFHTETADLFSFPTSFALQNNTSWPILEWRFLWVEINSKGVFRETGLWKIIFFRNNPRWGSFSGSLQKAHCICDNL